MIDWKRKVVAEVLLWVCLAATAAGRAAYLAVNGQDSVGSAFLLQFAFTIILSSWVAADARGRGCSLCYDFDSFIFFAWPIALPCYLFQTRGLRAFLGLLCFAGLWLAGGLFGGMVYGVLWLFTR